MSSSLTKMTNEVGNIGPKLNMNIAIVLIKGRLKKELFTGVQLFTQLEMNREDHVTTRPDEI